jgi:hypothetical protein
MNRKTKKNRNGNRPPTLAEVVAAERDRMNQNLFAHAATASNLAKIMYGERRERAYAIKHRALRRLVDRGDVLVGVDHWHSPGLLSIKLPGVGRLHSHENWLRGA